MGERRLARLGEEFDVRVERRFLEIHPETPAEGRPVSELGYPPEQWARMMEDLTRMGKAEGIVFSERSFTTNSHKALLLAVAAKEEGPEVFEALNEGLFRAYFTERKNIGDPQVLRDVAQAAGVSAGRIARAWSEEAYEGRLTRDHDAAARIGITGIPTFIVDDRWIIEGAVPVEMLREAAKKASGGSMGRDRP
ncbi:MAG TPA: DsbA family protein [Deltaproteobacteria bacterium]|nr:DsbA family protein [Deltaproteobacteria bacterium]HBG72721.1 DsbA family protein [Deltaproteobacteria bacterium]